MLLKPLEEVVPLSLLALNIPEVRASNRTLEVLLGFRETGEASERLMLPMIALRIELCTYS